MTKLDVTPEKTKHIANLASLKLSPEEEEGYSSQLTKIITFINKLEKIDTKNVEPLFAPSEARNVMREDQAETGLTQEEATKNAPVIKNGTFVVSNVWKK